MLENNTLLDTKALRQLYAKKMFRNIFFLGAIALSLVFMGLLIYDIVVRDYTSMWLVTIGLFLCVLSIMAYLGVYFRAMKSMDKVDENPIINYKFGDEFIEYTSFTKKENNERKIELKLLTTILETKDYFFMVLDTNEGLVVNKNCFVGGGIEDFKKRFKLYFRSK